MINVPNVVTVSRVGLTLGTLLLLYSPSDQLRWTAFGLTAFIIYADALDGYLARKLNQASKFGAILDIAGDRVVEMAYWIAFAALGWIPVWVPLVFLVRGTFVDAIRSFASEQGYTAFGAKTMMQSGIGKFLVSSNFSRFTYAVVKALAFCIVIAAHTTTLADTCAQQVGMALVYASVAFCLIRGLPVVFESDFLFKAAPTQNPPSAGSSAESTVNNQ